MADQYPELTEALCGIHAKREDVVRRLDYLRDRQPDVYDPDAWLDEFGPYVSQPRINVCPAVVKSKTDRLTVAGFTAVAGTGTTSDDVKAANAVWRRSKMPWRSELLHEEAVAAAKGYAMVGLNARGQAFIAPQDPAWCWMKWDDLDVTEPAAFAKVWVEEKRVYVQIDDGTTIRVWRTNTERWTTEILPVTSNAFELIEERAGTGKVMAAEYDNNGSDLDPVHSLQDQINLLVTEIFLIAHQCGWPVRVLTGTTLNGAGNKLPELSELSDLLPPDSELLEPPDTNGDGYPDTAKPGEVEISPKRMLVLESPQARASTLAAADLTGPLKVLESKYGEVAFVSRRTVHQFRTQGGDFPSGAAQWEADKAARNDEKRTKMSFGDAHAYLAAVAVMAERAHNPDGTRKTDVDPVMPAFETQWEPDEEAPLSKAERVQIELELGVDPEHILVELLDEDPVTAKRLAALIVAQRETALAAFDAGDDTGSEDDDSDDEGD